MRPGRFVDPLDPTATKDPFPAYNELRRTDPVHWQDRIESWLLTRYNDCAMVLSNAQLFASDFRRVGIPTPEPLVVLQTLDPPDHTMLRQFAKEALRMQDFGALEKDASSRADELLDSLAERDTFNFINEFAYPLTAGTICRLVGIATPDLKEWIRLRKHDFGQSVEIQSDPEADGAGSEERAGFSERLNKLLDGGHSEGLLGYIAHHLGEAGVSRDVLVNSLLTFWHAGVEVPSWFLGNAVSTLLENQEAFWDLGSLSSFGTAVEELIRFCGPVHALSRACTEEIKLRDKTIRKGDIVIAMIAAGNRDPDQFANPDMISWKRTPNQHLGFGRGAHVCLGANIARMQTRLAIPKILKRFRHMRSTGVPQPRPNVMFRGLVNLPMTFASD